MLDGPFGAACFLFNHLARRGIAVPPGTWISSGAVTGVHRVAIGDHVDRDLRWPLVDRMHDRGPLNRIDG